VTARRERPAARILLTDEAGRVLLFRFVLADRAPFWVTPGGAVDPGETHEEAARRELREETGLVRDIGPEVARRLVEFIAVEGDPVVADERYYRVRVTHDAIDTAGHTELERQVMQQWRWFNRAEIAVWPEQIYPVDLVEMLAATD
jgi:8-oxo-dGTP pyrophosphatase MutT (NUDIX family)